MSASPHSPLDHLADAQPLRTIAIPGHPSTATRHRWRLTGIAGPDGTRIRLRCWTVGGRILTTPAAVAEYIAALSADRDAGPPPESDADVERRGREAGAALERLGC